jgi:pimeloyl-ACP methyl ester carboxylesterase
MLATLPVVPVVMHLRQWLGVQFHPGVIPMLILFLHGWQSTPGGVKPTYLRSHGHTVLSPALPDDDFAAAVTIAQVEFDQHRPDVVVGSSRGGAVAMNIDAGDTPLVLLCPA